MGPDEANELERRSWRNVHDWAAEAVAQLEGFAVANTDPLVAEMLGRIRPFKELAAREGPAQGWDTPCDVETWQRLHRAMLGLLDFYRLRRDYGAD